MEHGPRRARGGTLRYTKIIAGIEDAPEGSELAAWRTQESPAIGKAYWHLGEHGTVLDLMKAIRADEANRPARRGSV